MGHDTKILNRSLVVAGAILIQLALGAIYAWSVFTARLTDVAGVYAFTASQAAWVFSSGLATFAIVMVLAGRVLPSMGPRLLSVAGGLLLGTGYILGGFLGDNFWVQLTCIGIISGAGIGLAYVVPISVCVKRFRYLWHRANRSRAAGQRGDGQSTGRLPTCRMDAARFG